MKTKILLVVLYTAVIIAGTRYLTPEKIKIETKTEKVVETQIVEKVVTKTIERPDGTKETTTVVDRDINRNSNTTTDRSKEVIVAHNSLNVSLLAGAQPKLYEGVSLGPIVYGASVTKTLLGPITIGAWILSNPSVGLSIGLNF